MSFYVEILTPEKRFFTGDIETLILKTPNGEMGVLANHTPMVSAVAIGIIRIKQDGEWLDAVLSEGFMEIKNDKTVILVDTAEWPDEIDINRASEAQERAAERLQSKLSYQEYMQSKAAIARAAERLKISKKI